MNKPRSGGKSTWFGAGVCISAAIGPRRTVGVHGLCSYPAPIFDLQIFVRLCWNLSEVDDARLIYGNKFIIKTELGWMSATVKVILPCFWRNDWMGAQRQQAALDVGDLIQLLLVMTGNIFKV